MSKEFEKQLVAAMKLALGLSETKLFPEGEEKGTEEGSERRNRNFLLQTAAVFLNISQIHSVIHPLFVSRVLYGAAPRSINQSIIHLKHFSSCKYREKKNTSNLHPGTHTPTVRRGGDRCLGDWGRSPRDAPAAMAHGSHHRTAANKPRPHPGPAALGTGSPSSRDEAPHHPRRTPALEKATTNPIFFPA